MSSMVALEILLSSMPDKIESPTVRVIFLPHFGRFSFELVDIWGFSICVIFSCCFKNWFSIMFVDLFSISRCCCVSSFRSLSLCVMRRNMCNMFICILISLLVSYFCFAFENVLQLLHQSGQAEHSYFCKNYYQVRLSFCECTLWCLTNCW